MFRLGIPRALLYYQYYPMWRTFFTELGAEVVVSTPTTQAMLGEGSARVVADTCLPVKIFLGHVLALVGKCDFIFIPAIRSVKRNIYNCAKFLGLPDMTRAVIPECPPILDTEIDINRGKLRLYQAIYQLGQHFSWNPLRVRQAGRDAWQAHLDYRELMAHHQLTPVEAIARISGTPDASPQASPDQATSSRATIALIGHPYLLYDSYINHQLIKRLKQGNNRVLTPEMLTPRELAAATSRMVGKAYWTYEEEVIGAGGHYRQSGADGVIGLMAFGCGPDSLMMDMVRRETAGKKTTSFLNLTLDEHTAEAGLLTRLEAFTDMIYRRKGRELTVCV